MKPNQKKHENKSRDCLKNLMMLSSTQERVYTVLKNYTSGKFSELPSIERIAQDSSLSVSTVQRTLVALTSLGLIRVTSGKTIGAKNLYTLLIPLVNRANDHDQPPCSDKNADNQPLRSNLAQSETLTAQIARSEFPTAQGVHQTVNAQPSGQPVLQSENLNEVVYCSLAELRKAAPHIGKRRILQYDAQRGEIPAIKLPTRYGFAYFTPVSNLVIRENVEQTRKQKRLQQLRKAKKVIINLHQDLSADCYETLIAGAHAHDTGIKEQIVACLKIMSFLGKDLHKFCYEKIGSEVCETGVDTRRRIMMILDFYETSSAAAAAKEIISILGLKGEANVL